jgi:ATP-binding cassette subfamily C protein PrsD
MMMRARGQRPASGQLARLKGAFVGVGVFSAAISILMLTGSIYMLQIYDRVLTSRSIPTLIGMSAIVVAAFALQGLLDAVRARMLARIGAMFDEGLSPKVFDLIRRATLRGARGDQATQGARDLDAVRSFLASPGPTAFFDMPFTPIFFIGCYLLHPVLGAMALFGVAMIFTFTLWTERATRKPAADQTSAGSERQLLVDASRRNAEALQAMGMGPTFRERWRSTNARFVEANLSLADSTSGIGAAAKVFRMAFQSAILGVGAYLVILQQLSPGAMIAASILAARALAPIETAVAHWKGFVAARQAFARLNASLELVGEEGARTELPPPRLSFTAEDLSVGVPGRSAPLIAGANIALKAGEGLLLIGASGSGKSTLLRSLAGVWPIQRGAARLDGATIDQWDPVQLGRHMGYMPQDVELFEGSVAENIARFLPDARDEDIVGAAKRAGAHDLILKLPDGYGTRIGEAGMTLSAGQRQRIGLARALFGEPFLLLLDEPNSNLDTDGEAALVQAVAAARARGGVAIVVSHKTSLLSAMDYVGRVHEGRLQIITRDEYRQNLMRAAQARQAETEKQAGPAATAGALR